MSLNILDKAIEFVAPVTAERRALARTRIQASEAVSKVLNTGYSNSGASVTKKSMKGWTSKSLSPSDDIDTNLGLLRQRARDLFMGSPLARSAINTTRTNVVGAGLRPKIRLDSDFLGLSQDEASAWKIKTEREFNLWAESVHCDVQRMHTFYELQQLAKLSWLMNGDVFILFKYEKNKTAFMPYQLRLLIIEADRVSTPTNYSKKGKFFNGIYGVNPNNGNEIISGVEIDKNGAVVAYHIADSYPNDVLVYNKKCTWERVEAFGAKTGRPNILHLMEAERPGQLRGVPFLAPVIEVIKQLTRYTESEVLAAVIASMFTVFIKSNGPSTELPIGNMLSTTERISTSPVEYELGSGAINVLEPGESIEIADPKRPNANADAFINAFAKYIGAALEIPADLLQKSFNASYSASRAALLEAWKMFRMRRSWLAQDLCQPIYEAFIDEAVSSGRVDCKDYFTDPIIRKAWTSCEWTGPAPGQLDPTKEAQAAEMRVASGFSTREKEADEINSTDFESNIKQAKREKELMKEAGLIEGQETSGAMV